MSLTVSVEGGLFKEKLILIPIGPQGEQPRDSLLPYSIEKSIIAWQQY